MPGKTEGRRRRWATEDEMVGWPHGLSGGEFGQTPGDVKDRGACSAAVHGVTKRQTRLIH